MKTVEEFYKELAGSKELQEEFKNIKDKDTADTFLKNHDCGAAAHEFAEYIKSQMKNKEGELSDDEASSAAGGEWIDQGEWGKYWKDPDGPEYDLYPTYVCSEKMGPAK